MSHPPVLRDGGYVVVPQDTPIVLMAVPLSLIRVPDNHVGMDLDHVHALVERVHAGDTLIPVLLSRAGEDFWLIDGRHRYVTALVLGRDRLLALVADRVEMR